MTPVVIRVLVALAALYAGLILLILGSARASGVETTSASGITLRFSGTCSLQVAEDRLVSVTLERRWHIPTVYRYNDHFELAPCLVRSIGLRRVVPGAMQAVIEVPGGVVYVPILKRDLF